MLKVLHLASFEGNLGDNANVESIQANLRRALGALIFTRLEMREFYWQQRCFDEQFAELANAHDLIVIGGGNYFEVWVEKSCSGMSIDIPYAILRCIRPRIVFYGLGFDPGMGYSATTLSRSRAYFDYLLAHPDKYLVSVRNDGSSASLHRLHGAEIATRVEVVPDGGFFLDVIQPLPPWLPRGQRYLAINLAGDMLECRHPGGTLLSADGFADEFATLLSTLHDRFPDLGLVFIPHIFRDIGYLAALIERLPDPLRRRQVYMAPYTHGSGPHEAVFALYRHAACTLGVRLHANVCPIALGCPTVGLANMPQIIALHDELGIPHRVVDIRTPGFSGPLFTIVCELLDNDTDARAENRRIGQAMRVSADRFHARLKQWLEHAQ